MRENLDYLLEAIQAEMFDQHIYPLISDKAALYCFNIIAINFFPTEIKGLDWKQL
ncbi:MAG: hypothetical protein IPI77_20015 [Saprospiraceae bacterium]|nr:hypothetical protein [Saprospiraceae bacterium]